MKPIPRNFLRLYLGKQYYRLKRYYEWYFSNKKYAKELQSALLPIKVFSHQSLLLRQLKDVDMWMQHNKIKNLQLAIKQLDGILIKPGETFSYWRLIGHTSRRKGYVDGMTLFYGTFRTGIGGGLCQLSNLIYWMTLHTPLNVSERHRHSYDVFPDSNRKQPFGSGATCFYNYLDLQIKNDTEETYQLHLNLTDKYLVGEWRTTSPAIQTYKVYEKKHWITQEYWGGYVRHNTIHRKVYNGVGTQIDDQFITENHAIMMYNPFLEEAKG
jgi:vancomycin resistance protein VanW